MGGFKSFRSAAITLAGIELAHRIRKRQFSLGRGSGTEPSPNTLIVAKERINYAEHATSMITGNVGVLFVGRALAGVGAGCTLSAGNALIASLRDA